ncbi:hypothetical protein [Pyxidicoccus sp. MSG2]|uniref:hypothetical protein n=1 Tax=Pyxidicoccus sp. MSG2 TaxID=2996790 RepID=UPI00226FC597|nr:hypothetical protein [Pyxidicoccus sp. MSG2]MCY1019359.1 hypothetical protein [Pyxidicoccus sp. MSG2]
MTLACVLFSGARSVLDPTCGFALLEAHCTQAPKACQPRLEELAGGSCPAPLPNGRWGWCARCDAKVGRACFLLGNAHEEGRLGQKPESPSATESYRKGYDAGDTRACERVR